MKRNPPFLVSLIPFAVLVGLLTAVVRVFDADALQGGSQVSLLIASAVATAIGIFLYKRDWADFEEAINSNLSAVGTAIVVLILIGAVSGTWMVSGVVPVLIYYGLEVLSPKIFLFAACLICSLVSLMTGSSWTTIATIGVALMGIGMALGYDTGWTAGAIISGAYFGDKISPLSDTTVLASSSAGVPLFTHIRYMLITTVPSITIAAIVFLFASIFHEGASETMVMQMQEGLDSAFNLSPFLMAVPVLTGLMIAKKVPAIITLFLSSIMASVAAVIAQPDIMASLGGSFKGAMLSLYGHTGVDTGNAVVNSLVETEGMKGMLNTIFLILCASTFGASLKAGGMLRTIAGKVEGLMKGRTSLVASTVGTGIFNNMVTGDQYLSIILGCNLYKDVYKAKGYEGRLLSRSVEDGTTVTSVLIPWNSCGMTQSTVLKVYTVDYLPYCVFNYVSPLCSILIAATGYRIYKKIS